MSNRTFDQDNALKVLETAQSSDHAFAGSQIFGDCDRVVYILIAHASIALTKFSVQVATDASGTSAADAGTTITSAAAGKAYTIEVTPGALTATKTYVSPFVDVSAGTYTLLELRTRLRNPGTISQDTTYPTAVFNA